MTIVTYMVGNKEYKSYTEARKAADKITGMIPKIKYTPVREKTYINKKWAAKVKEHYANKRKNAQ